MLANCRPSRLRQFLVPESVESVGFTLNGERVEIENQAPFALAGDSPDGTDYQPVALGTGAYVLQATPYSADRLEGIAGTPLEILFVIVNTEEDGVPPTTENATLKAYPNPVARTFTIGTDSELEAIAPLHSHRQPGKDTHRCRR